MTTIEVQEIHSCRREVTIQIPSDVMEKELEAVYAKLGKERRIPGFRPGKAPVKIIKRYFREEGRSDTIREQVRAGYLESLKEKKLEVVGDPEFSEINWPEGGDLQFKVTVDVRPSIEVNDYLGINLTRKNIQVEEEEIDQTIEGLRERSVKYETEEERPLKEGDWALVGYRPSNSPEKEWVEGGLLEIDGSKPDGIGGQMVGMNPGEARTVKVPASEQKDSKAATTEFEVRLQEVKKKVLPEVSDEWAKKWGEFQGVNELREQIRKDILMGKEMQSRREMEGQVISDLLERYEFDLPPRLLESLVEEYRKELNEYAARRPAPKDENPPEEEIEKIARKRAEEELRLHYILAEIIRQEKIEADAESIAEEMNRLAAQRGISPLELRKELEERDRMGVIMDRIVRSRAMDFLIEKAKIKEIN